MRDPPLILAVDDEETNLASYDLLFKAEEKLYALITAADGLEALSQIEAHQPDLILLDIMMPNLSGIEVCKRIRADASLPFIPIIIVSAMAASDDIIEAFDAGANGYLTKPIDGASFTARIKSMLDIKAQADSSEKTKQDLQNDVREQLEQLERSRRVQRFVPPQLVDMLKSSGGEKLLESHRREISLVCCRLRDFTKFSDEVEPEEMIAVLAEYHSAMGALIYRFKGMLEHFMRENIVVFFNDPLPLDNHPQFAIIMANAMRARMCELKHEWNRRGYELGFSVGISMGFASLGTIGFEHRSEYSALGMVAVLAEELCARAGDDEILIDTRIYSAIESVVEASRIADISLDGLSRQIGAYKVNKVDTGSESEKAAESGNPDGLTLREFEVLTLIAKGKTNKEIASELFISTKTVNTHMSNIFGKIHVSNRTEAAGYALAIGS